MSIFTKKISQERDKLEYQRLQQERDKKEFQKLQKDFAKFFKDVLLGGKQYVYADSDEKDYNKNLVKNNMKDGTETIENGIGFNNTEPNFTIYQQFAQHDICIKVGDESFPCHKAFLTGRSEYFNAMFNGPFAESISSVFTISDCTPETFILILEFIYTDKCEIPASMAYELLIKADMYLLDKL